MDRYLIIAAEESDSTVGFYDSDGGKEVARVRVGEWPHELTLSGDRRRAYVTNFGVKDYDERIGTPGNSISVIDTVHKCEVDRFYTFRNKADYWRFRAPHGAKVSPDGQRLFVNVETEDKLLIYDLEQEDHGARLRAPVADWFYGDGGSATDLESLPDEFVDLPAGTHNLLFSADGKHLWVIAGSGGLVELEVATGRKLRSFHCNGAIRGLSHTIDQRYLIASASDSICVLDPITLRTVREFTDLGVAQFLYSKQTPDGRYILAPAVWEGQLLRIDMETNDVEKLVVGADPIHVLIAPDDTHAYVSHGRSKHLTKVDWRRFATAAEIATRGGPNGIDWAPYSPKPERKILKFGACMPLSGGSRSEGQDLRLGYQYWQESVNEAGGILVGDQVYEVDVVLRDTQSRTGNEEDEPQPPEKHWSDRKPPEKNSIERLTEDLVRSNGVQFLFGGYPSPPNLHSGRMAQHLSVPFITASGAAGIIYQQGFDHVFGIMTSARGFLNGSFDCLATLDNPPRKVAFLSCEDPAARQDAETTAEYITSTYGMEILTQTGAGLPTGKHGIFLFDHLKTDFDRYLDVIERLRPDVLAITGHLPESLAVVRAMRARGLESMGILFSVGPALPAFANRLGASAMHMMGAAMWSSAQEGYGHDRWVRPQDYADAFFDRYSKPASYLSAGATACGVVYEEALRRAGSIDPAAVKEVLRRPDFAMESFYSRIEFDETGLNAKRPLITIQLRRINGQIVHVPLWPPKQAGKHTPVWPFPGWPDPTEDTRASQ